jgi:hypothetical protein
MRENAYYYLIAGLPDLIFEQGKPPFSTAAFLAELEEELVTEDFALVQALFLPADNRNLLGLLEKRDFQWDEHGSYSQAELEAGMRELDGLPAYMLELVEAFQKNAPLQPNMSWENQLTWLYYEAALEQPNDFLREWNDFERDLHNLRAALSARRHRLSLEGQLIGDYRLTSAARASNAQDFGLSQEYPFIQRLLVLEDEPDLREREEEIDILRWNYIDELNTFNYFTIEVLLGYLIKLAILERWATLSPEAGQEAFQRLVRQLEQSFEFPKEFSAS